MLTTFRIRGVWHHVAGNKDKEDDWYSQANDLRLVALAGQSIRRLSSAMQPLDVARPTTDPTRAVDRAIGRMLKELDKTKIEESDLAIAHCTRSVSLLGLIATLRLTF